MLRAAENETDQPSNKVTQSASSAPVNPFSQFYDYSASIVAITLPISIIYKTICNNNYFNLQCRVVFHSALVWAQIYFYDFVTVAVRLPVARRRCCLLLVCLSFPLAVCTHVRRCFLHSQRIKRKNEQWTKQKHNKTLSSTAHTHTHALYTASRKSWSLFIYSIRDFDELTRTAHHSSCGVHSWLLIVGVQFAKFEFMTGITRHFLLLDILRRI